MSASIHIGENIGQRIRRLRRETGMSQLRFTKVHGFERTQYLRWENGVIYPHQRNVERLAFALGVSAHYLHTGREDRAPTDALGQLKRAINRAIAARKSLSDIQRIVADA